MAWAVLLVMGAAWLLVALRFVRHLPLRTGGRVTVALMLLPLAGYYLLAAWWYGNFSALEWPRPALVAIGWAFGSFLLLAMLLLARDALAGLLFLPFPGPARRLLHSRRVSMVLGALALALGAYGTWEGLRVPDVRRVEIVVPGLPAAFEGYRIALLSDLHATRLLPQEWQRAVVEKTNGLGAELIVISGDLEDGSPAQRAGDVAPFADLRAIDGVFAVPGNHEYYVDYPGWMTALRALGLPVLENRHAVIARGADRLVLAGLTDPQARAFGQAPPDLGAALAGAPAGVPVVLLTHRPGAAPQHARAGVRLQLAGHTHGGQILGPNLLTKWANNGFLAGVYQVDGMPLYVSRGAGLWHGLVLRLGAPSEITELVLHAR